MQSVFDALKLYFTYPFVWYALVVGTLVALSASLLGVTLVLRRFSFIGTGLSNVAFGAFALATLFRMTNQSLLALPVTMGFAVLLLRGGDAKIKGDAAVAMLSVGALAAGYLLINTYSVSVNVSADVCTALFGSTSILTLSPTDVWLTIGMSAAVLVLFVLFYNHIFAVTFDEGFAAATGVAVKRYNLFLALVTGAVIVLAMDLVGSLLISALVIFPAVSAMRLFRSFLSVVVCAGTLSAGCAVFGILTSIVAGTPVGATIVAVNVAAFAIFSLVGKLKGGSV